MLKRYLTLSVLILSLSACSTNDRKATERPTVSESETTNISDNPTLTDIDGDGWVAEDDCNDQDAAINPEAREECNGIDDNCNGQIDDDAGERHFVDADEDSFGYEFLGHFCDTPEGSVTTGGDCADDNPNVYPGNTAQVDGKDSDCDGRKDWKVTVVVAVDDAGEICINNEVIGSTGEWPSGEEYEVWLQSGTHTVGIHGWDTGYVITAAIAHLEISDGSMWTTDSAWRYDPEPNQEGIGKQGWCGTGFDDSDWDFAQDIGPIGDPSNPWGDAPFNFPESSPAHWIWDHFPVELNTQYLRTEFVLP